MHDSETLKYNFPDVAFEMECDQIRAELDDKLGLQSCVNVNGKEAIATLTLNDGFELLIKPMAPGFHGYKHWFKWRELTHPKTGETLNLSQLRCSVELIVFEAETDSYPSVIAFGVDAPSLDELISKTLDKIRKHCGLRLVALPVVKTNN